MTASELQTAMSEIGSDDPRYPAMLDRQIAMMWRLLSVMQPASTASALRALRDAFPDVPFRERIRVLDRVRH
jgi:hypothetical protein